MSNWTGTYSITAGATGTSTGGNLSNTFNNTGATWPTSGTGLANFLLRILTGIGAGQERTVLSNSATQIVISGSWTTIPDTSSTYELVLKLNNGDHVVADVNLSTNIITELEDSATILIDGLYSITMLNSCLARWNKSESTLVTFQPNNRSVQGKYGFWVYIELAATLSNPVNVSYIRIYDSQYPMLIRVSAGLGNGSGVHHIAAENCGNGGMYFTGTTTQNVTLSNMMTKNVPEGNWNLPAVATTNVVTIQNGWFENSVSSGISYSGSTAQQELIIRGCVLKKSWNTFAVNLAAGKTIEFSDNYISTPILSASLLRTSTVNAVGTYKVFRNSLRVGDEVRNGANSTATFISNFNDYTDDLGRSYDLHALRFPFTATSATSDSDYMASRNRASSVTIDTTEATTSTASPPQYVGLTSARTRAKTSKNRLHTIDNVQVSGLTKNEATLTFDCQNSHSGTTVNLDSTSGQPTLSVASTSDFTVGETVEIAYGTARYEEKIILSINAGISLTFTTNLIYTHLASDADTVKKNLRQIGLPFVKYGTSSGNYTMSTYVPKPEVWGEIYTGIQTTYDGHVCAWKFRGHSVTINGLRPSTTYYFKACAFNPMGELIDLPVESSFNTAIETDFTDPGITNVRLGTTYNINSPTPNRTGTLDLPSINNVELGVAFDGATKVGNVRLPAVGNVLNGVVYGSLDSLTGTYGDSTPPIFSGINSLVSQLDGSLLVGWNAASDPNPPIVYTIYIKPNTPVGLFSTTPFATEALSYRLYTLSDNTPLANGVTYYVGVRASDKWGNIDTNVVTLNAVSSGVSLVSSKVECDGFFSISSTNQLEGALWALDNGNIIVDPLLLGTASYYIYSATGVPMGISETGLTPDANGIYYISPTSAASLINLSSYLVKIEIIISGLTRTTYKTINISQATLDCKLRRIRNLINIIFARGE